MRLVWQLLAVAAVAFIGAQGVMAFQDVPLVALVLGLLVAVASVFVYRWVVRRTERRTVTELDWKGAASATSWGTLLGVGLFALVIVNIVFLGGYQVNGLGSPMSALGLVGFMAAVAVTEELMWRGVLFRIIEERTGSWIALALTGLAFGLVHLINPHATLWGAIAIAIEAGGMLTAAYIATRSLWLPIGLHFGWNIAGSAIFSTSVSGSNTPQGLLDVTISGPTIITGGDFGPEGSMYSVVFCVIVTVVLMWIARRRDRIVPVRRRGERPAATTTLPQ
ncbi:CPBP family intramembrane metalloprotease [Nocardiopsis dassonvillei]|uniref:CPBP family intramembrane glutamic endopeptidase n=1 Tax=Nocardiopsis dassonvillei TaxID=2014 RepID=UPI00200CD56A|nr:CPBP family intramembrane glutamic endopeptidase [Nocardiopsis dassonvillei]MCK9871664.1 CPBP family intramembrane metalloprotease [Nocardiopsis dassonvillei]